MATRDIVALVATQDIVVCLDIPVTAVIVALVVTQDILARVYLATRDIPATVD